MTASAYDGKLFSLALGGKLGSGVVQRGARTYDGIQASPVIFLGFFDERVQLVGTSLEFQDFIVADIVRGRSKLSFISDDPFLKTAGAVDIRSSRPTTLEWMTRLELFLPSFATPWVQFDLAYARELKEHRGSYFELTGRATLARLFPEKGKARFEPQLFVTLGFGDTGHNDFWYGAGAGSGFTHVEYGIAVVAPARIDRHFPVFRFYRYDLLRTSAVGPGQLVAQTGGFQADAIFAFGIF